MLQADVTLSPTPNHLAELAQIWNYLELHKI